MQPTKKEIKEFSVKMADIVFNQANENETMMDFESKIPNEFVLNLMNKDSVHIKNLLAVAIEKDATASPDEYLEHWSISDQIQGDKLTYQVSLRDFEYVISDYIIKVYNIFNPIKQFDETKINKMILLTQVIGVQYIIRSRRNKLDKRRKKDVENAMLMNEITEMLIKAKKNKTLDITSLIGMG